MPIVDIAQLTNEQRWGFTFDMDKANAEIAKNNAMIEDRNIAIRKQNETRPINQPETPELVPEELWTLQRWVDKVIADLGNQAAVRLNSYAEQVAIELFRAAPPETQAKVRETLGVPNIVNE